MRKKWVSGVFFGAGLLASLVAVAAPAPLRFRHELSIEDFQGKTFLDAMMAEDGGIKSLLDDDYRTEYAVAGWRAVKIALANFDTKNRNKVLKSFEDGEDGLHRLIQELQGTTFTPATAVGMVRSRLRGGDVFGVAQVIAMGSGAGTLVRIDEENYYYNYGYKSGEEADDVKSGRSFGASPGHNANDASDVMFLNELEKYLDSTAEPRVFYTAMLRLLTQCDAWGYGRSRLSDEGQTVLTDFLAIYTAELDRHLMVELDPRRHPWENDLAEVTFVLAFGTAVGQVMLNGELVDGQAREWWAPSAVSNRSGIGITRQDRRRLQKAITVYEREHHPELVAAIEAVIGSKKDVFRGLMEYLNNVSTQPSVRANAAALTEAFVEFVLQVREDADAIAAGISDSP